MMKYIVATLIFLLCFQFDSGAQSRRNTRHKKYSHRHHRHRPATRHTYYRTHNRPVEPPSVYKGDNTPVNDGQRKNKNRNLNYNTGQPLPASNGR